MDDPCLAPIGVIDSGVGGLTVMNAIRALLPHENIVYFGDTGRVPYGSKSGEMILRYSIENVAFLMREKIKLLVIACHTISCYALSDLQKTFPIPIVGMIEPSVAQTVQLYRIRHETLNLDRAKAPRLGDRKSVHIRNMDRLTIVQPRELSHQSKSTFHAECGIIKNGKIGITGTRATIASEIYQTQIRSHLPEVEIISFSCPLFVPLIEEGYIDHPMTELAVRQYLGPLKTENIQALILACTHYPLLQPHLQKELGPSVTLIDPGAQCAEAVKKKLEDKNLLNPSNSLPTYRFFVSDDPEKFRLLGKSFLNYPIESVSTK